MRERGAAELAGEVVGDLMAAGACIDAADRRIGLVVAQNDALLETLPVGRLEELGRVAVELEYAVRRVLRHLAPEIEPTLGQIARFARSASVAALADEEERRRRRLEPCP